MSSTTAVGPTAGPEPPPGSTPGPVGAALGCGPALVVLQPGRVGLEERPVLAPTRRQVVVRPQHVGVCGTDLEIIEGTLDPEYVRYPLVLGHEWSGVVHAVGDAVTTVAVGDPVVVEGIVPCGTCPACRAGDTNLCETYDELGFTRDGAAGPGVTVAEHLVHRLAPGVPLEAGALVEPASVVLRGLLATDLVPGLRTLVVGDGTVGLLAAHLLRLWSPASVTVSGVRSEQRTLALAMGADEHLLAPPELRSFDYVVEAAGSTVAVDTALHAVRRGGQVLVLGIAGHGATLPVSPDDLVNNDLRLRGSFGYTASAWRRTTELMNAGLIDPLPLVTHRYPLAEHAAAVRVLAQPDSGPRGKVVLDLTRP